MADPVPSTVPAALARAARRFGDGEAIVDHSTAEPTRLTYRELHARVREFAAVLLARGIGAGDRVAVNAPNTHQWIVAALGTMYAGGVLVPVNTRFTGPETLDVLRRSRARVLVIAGPFLGTDRLAALRAAAATEPAAEGTATEATEPNPPVPGLDELELVVRVPVEAESNGPNPTTDPSPGGGDEHVLDWADLDTAPRASVTAVDTRARAVAEGDVSDVLFTSGTTGRSKGARSAHRQALGVAEAWAEHGQLDESDRYLVINPFFHSFGYKAGILPCLLRGATLVPLAVFEVERALDLVAQEGITVLPGPPTVYQTMLDHPGRADYDLSSLRLAVTGAATVPVALIERMRDELTFDTVLTAYGLTEAVVATMCQPGDDPATIGNTCGRPIAGFDLRIADSAGNQVPTGSVGEVLLRGPNTMLGYLDDPAATAQAVDAHGWLHTGDLGRVDDRDYLTITDRLKDMYICGGFNVYPAEIEQALARLDGVAESAVIGVPDERLGQVGKAYVIPRPGYALTVQDIVEHCRQRLANYKVPRQVEFPAELPRNPSGKVLKRRLG